MVFVCIDCKLDLPKTNFAKNQLKKDKEQRRCKNCAAAKNAESLETPSWMTPEVKDEPINSTGSLEGGPDSTRIPADDTPQMVDKDSSRSTLESDDTRECTSTQDGYQSTKIGKTKLDDIPEMNEKCTAEITIEVHSDENAQVRISEQVQPTIIAASSVPQIANACEEVKSPPSNRIRLGICAMQKKAKSKPMGEILKRLDCNLFEIVYFGDNVILNAPVEDWPLCDVLIAFYSNGYPLEKAEAYADLRKPLLLNDLKMQRILMDRRRVYDLLEASGIDVPRHVFMNRDGYISNPLGRYNELKDSSVMEETELIEHDDHIEVGGVSIHKPFVEKPVDADDHNIAIYYPSTAGGGCKKLFRKIGDRSSEFYPDINEVRREGSYIYEEFVETQGTDVKMYTVGPAYGHAEARKSPTVDGKVERNDDGKEVRFPVILTLKEKEIARKIVTIFRQMVCGFDLLRVQEVCFHVAVFFSFA